MLLLYQGPISFINQNHRQPRKSFLQNVIGSIDLVYWYIRYPWERERAGRECFFVLFGFYSNTYSYMATCIYGQAEKTSCTSFSFGLIANLTVRFLFLCKFTGKNMYERRERERVAASRHLALHFRCIHWLRKKKKVERYRESDTERKTRLLFIGLVFYLII